MRLGMDRTEPLDRHVRVYLRRRQPGMAEELFDVELGRVGDVIREDAHRGRPVGVIGLDVDRVDLAPEQRTKIKEYVVKEKVAPATVKERITVGSTLPADVQIRRAPSDWGPSVSKYSYIYSDNRVHFVDPANRRVIHSLD